VANYHWLLGKIFAQEEHIDEAEAEFLHALRLEPESSRVHNEYAVLLLNQKGLPREAFEHFSQASMQTPNDPLVRKNYLVALKAKNSFYWPYWKYCHLTRKWSKTKHWLVLAGTWILLGCLLVITGDNYVLSSIALLLMLIWWLVQVYLATVNPLFNFFAKRGWLK
jgi:tetratricopeptide (TPR) repeat protein